MFLMSEFPTVSNTTELATSPLEEFVVYVCAVAFPLRVHPQRSFQRIPWMGETEMLDNSDFHTIFHTAELSTNSLGEVYGVWQF